MKLIELTVSDFNNQVASSTPAPGGGSVSALALSLGTALTNMVGALSVGKKSFKAKDIELQESFKNVINQIETANQFFMEAIDKDTEAFNMIMDAFKMPKTTKEEQKERSLAIQNATKLAIEVPFKVAGAGINVLEKLDIIVQHGNKNTISDIGVAVLLICSGIEGALLNVKINLPGLKDETLKAEYQNKVETFMKIINAKKANLMETVYQAL